MIIGREVQEQIKGKLIKKIQSIDAKNKYLLNFKRWPIFEFLELEFILQIRMAMIFFGKLLFFFVFILTISFYIYIFSYILKQIREF